MFLLKDNYKERKNRIKGFLKTEPPIAIILSAVHFEWTVRRAIIALGKSPNVEIRSKFSKRFYFDKYKEIWKEEISTPMGLISLVKVVQKWDELKKAIDVRNKLVHGIESCDEKFATPKVEFILNGANAIRIFCENKGVDLYKRLPVRRVKSK